MKLVGAVLDALDVSCESRSVVGFDDNRVQSRIRCRSFEPRRQRGEKAAERSLDLDADDRIVRSRHAGVGQVRCALRQNALVRGLHVRVSADDRRHLSIQIPAHRELLRRCFGMEVDEDDSRSSRRGFQRSHRHRPDNRRRCDDLEAAGDDESGSDHLMPGDLQRRGQVRQGAEGLGPLAGDRIDAIYGFADRSAVARTCEVTAIARHAGRVVGRPQETRLGSDVVERLLLVPDVIARGHHVDAEVEDLLANLARDTETAGRVLRVGNDEVDLMALDEAGQALTQQITSRFADDIADEEQPHEWPIG